jgi:hypothetical protein
VPAFHRHEDPEAKIVKVKVIYLLRVDTYSTQLALCLGVESVNIARHAFSKVSFQGGVGIDASGLTREFFGNTNSTLLVI